jgi:hypothetical protein
MALRATVQNGRIIVDEPTDLPDGTILYLVADDEGDALDDEARERLHAQLAVSWRSAQAGRTRPASELLAELRARRR